jgi:hypothetical protein
VAAEWPGFIAGRRHDPSFFRPGADQHGLAAQLRAIPLLDRREELVHVDVEDMTFGSHLVSS